MCLHARRDGTGRVRLGRQLERVVDRLDDAHETETTTTEAAKPTIVSIVVVNAAPKGGIVRQTLSEGDHVVLVVKSDVADEIHLHGYDKSTDVTAGGTARLPFTATIPGRFEVELESRGVQIADLTVNP